MNKDQALMVIRAQLIEKMRLLEMEHTQIKEALECLTYELGEKKDIEKQELKKERRLKCK